FDGESGVRAWRTRAERPWWAVNTNPREIAIETFMLPPHSVSINPGTEGGAVVWQSPVSGTVEITGKLVDGDPYDGVGVMWAIDHATGSRRGELCSGTLANGSSMTLAEGRFSERLKSVQIKHGDRIYLQIRLRTGDAHYDITNVDFTIRALDGSGTWDLKQD